MKHVSISSDSFNETKKLLPRNNLEFMDRVQKFLTHFNPVLCFM